MKKTREVLRPHYIRRNLLGALETALFMRSGPEKFSQSLKGMKLSFLLPLLILPFSIIPMIAAHPDTGLSMTAMNVLAVIYGLRTVIYLAGFTAIMYFLAKNMGRMDGFYRFVTANNFLVLPVAVLMLPLSLGFMSGMYSWEQVYPMMVCFTLYSYAYTAYMSMHVLKIPLELAVFVSICSMAINQSALDLMKWLGAEGIQLFA